jgi:putative transposase
MTFHPQSDRPIFISIKRAALVPTVLLSTLSAIGCSQYYWLTTTPARRWHEHRQSTGQGHLYQGRFKSFPVENDAYLLTVLHYVERNPLRAGMVQRAEYRPYASLRRRLGFCGDGPLLAPSPVPCREDWLTWVNEPQTDKEMEELRTSVRRGRPFGSPAWQARYATMLGLESTSDDGAASGRRL